MKINRMYFFTATILKWQQLFHHKEISNIILNSLYYLVSENHARLYGYVIMPNHIHLIWEPLQENLQLRFMKFTGQQIKFYLTDNLKTELENFEVNKLDRHYQIWQRNPLSVDLYSRKVIEQKLDYIHCNPTSGKWQLVKDPIDYPLSSFRYYELGEENSFLTHYQEFIG